MYDILDEEECVKRFSLESKSLVVRERVRLSDGSIIHPSKKPWDATIIDPPGLLIEMQGEGHSSNLVNMRNAVELSIAEKQERDLAYANVAIRAGWSVLWLWVDRSVGGPDMHRDRWVAQIREAVAYVVGNGVPKLFSSTPTL